METQYYQHTCKCGCGGQIEVKKWHKYNGIPIYIKGHATKDKSSLAYRKGKTVSEETRQKIKKSKKGTIPWNKGLKNIYSEETLIKMREANKGRVGYWKGKHLSEETRRKQSEIKKGKYTGEKHPNFGKSPTEETRQKMRDARKDRFSGENCPSWQNGKSFEEYPIEFKQIKKSILERDNYKCQYPGCIEIHDRLHVHHIDYNKQNNDPENLITLCNSCHSKTIGKNKRNYYTEFYQNIMMGKLMECLL